MKHRQVFLNAITTLLQVIGNAAILFFLYRFLIRALGMERLGIWSLVLATTSVVTLANQGWSTSIVKFVAKYAAHEKPREVCILVETALVSIGLALGVALLVLYPVAKWALRLLLPIGTVAEAYAILPFAIAALWINVTGSILQAGLAGHELITECNYVDLATSLLYLALAFWLVPSHGLLGLAYAQLTQSAAYFFALWLLLKRRLPSLSLIPTHWNPRLFREAAGYGTEFQIITTAQALREPVTKALLTKFGGLSMTGLYDISARYVVTVREFIVQSNQVLVPTASHLHERDPESVPIIYRESYRLIFFLAVPAFALLLVLSPAVSRIWIGHYEPVFVFFVALLTAGWFVNVLSNPAYVIRLGTGALRSVTAGCVVTAFLNFGLGFAAGKLFGGAMVVVASMFSLIAGYAIVIASYHLSNGVSLRQLLPSESVGILLLSLLGCAVFFPLLRASPAQSVFSVRSAAATFGALGTIVIVPMWIHPMRKRLVTWAVSKATA